MALKSIDLILNEEWMIYMGHINVRAGTRRFNKEIPVTKHKLKDIAHLHLDVADVPVLRFVASLVKEKKVALNINDALVGQDENIINIIDDHVQYEEN